MFHPVAPEPFDCLRLDVPESGVPGDATDDFPKYDMFSDMSIINWYTWLVHMVSHLIVGSNRGWTRNICRPRSTTRGARAAQLPLTGISLVLASAVNRLDMSSVVK